MLLAALVGDKGFVQAWEPQRAVRECLEITMALNGFQDRVEIVSAAASAEPGEAVLRTPTYYWGSTCVDLEQDPGGPDEGERCQLKRIDATWEYAGPKWPDQKAPPPLDFIKIDAEGHEPELAISNGGLDANWLTAHGIPTVTLGCGQRNIHSVHEELDVAEFHTARRIALRLATGVDSL